MRVSSVVAVSSFLVFAAAGAFAQGVTDPQIASIVVTANQVDIDAGKLAKAKASNADVKAFANQMITDHSGVNKQATDLVTKLKVKPEDNPTSQSLKSGGEKNVSDLKALLVKVRPAFEAHLAHARQVQASLSKT